MRLDDLTTYGPKRYMWICCKYTLRNYFIKSWKW